MSLRPAWSTTLAPSAWNMMVLSAMQKAVSGDGLMNRGIRLRSRSVGRNYGMGPDGPSRAPVADRSKGRFISLDALFRQVCGVYVSRLMQIQHSGSVDRTHTRRLLLYWANETRVLVTKLLAIYRLMENFPMPGLFIDTTSALSLPVPMPTVFQ
jgi:hypothetical protein